ncbi:MAG: sulfatase-like hydrolase/transferase [Acidobacteriota bacterium]|nr:sulfatase-like hydrolase/transferase [Acidobacteriota bacterium]
MRASAPSWAVFGLAVLQPLFDLIAGNIPFLLYQGADGLDAILVVVLVTGGGMIALALVHGVVHLALSESSAIIADAAVVGLLGGLFVLEILVRTALPAALCVALGGAAIPLLTWLTTRETTRLYLRYLAYGLVVIVAAFFARLEVRGFFAAGSIEVEAAQIADLFPVVLLVFDEFPLTSLLDERLEIDARAFPNFAELAERATWYRNGTTVWARTEESLSSILSGKVASLGVAPILSNYRENLFSLLAGSHELRVIETLSRLAPPNRDFQPEKEARPRRLAQLMADMGVVLLHTATPEAWRYRLPSIEGAWGNFWRLRLGADDDSLRLPTQHQGALPADERRRAERFRMFLDAIEPTEEPGLYFFHSLLPHTPYYYLPTGKVYKGEPFLSGDPRELWAQYPWFNLLTYQRHLLQVAFADRLIGELVDRLKEADLWDRALLIVVGDHGSSHWPQGSRRLPGSMPHPEDVLRVPLFVKYPSQQAGEIDDRNARTVDVLPTILDVVGAQGEYALDGLSLRSAATQLPERKSLRDRFGGVLTFTGAFDPDLASVERRLSLFDWSDGVASLIGIGPYRSLLGRRLDELNLEESPGLVWQVDQSRVLEAYDPAWTYVPAELTGTVKVPGAGGAEVHLVAAVNGRVAGFAHGRLTASGEARFSALVAQKALVAGPNEVEMLVAAGDALSPRLFRSAQQR